MGRELEQVMKIIGDECENYRVFLDGELFNSPKKIIFSADTQNGIIEYIFTNDHFPYWPSTETGEVTLEKING